MIFTFESFQLDIVERRLLRSGELIPLRAKVFDTLCILVENHGRLIRKDELMQRLWPDSVVEENNLDHNISKLRRALEDGANGQKFIETVPRQGYRFTAKVSKHPPVRYWLRLHRRLNRPPSKKFKPSPQVMVCAWLTPLAEAAPG